MFRRAAKGDPEAARLIVWAYFDVVRSEAHDFYEAHHIAAEEEADWEAWARNVAEATLVGNAEHIVWAIAGTRRGEQDIETQARALRLDPVRKRAPLYGISRLKHFLKEIAHCLDEEIDDGIITFAQTAEEREEERRALAWLERRDGAELEGRVDFVDPWQGKQHWSVYHMRAHIRKMRRLEWAYRLALVLRPAAAGPAIP